MERWQATTAAATAGLLTVLCGNKYVRQTHRKVEEGKSIHLKLWVSHRQIK